MARFYFPNQNPLGRLITYDDMAVTIVGVSTNARDHGLRDDVRRTYEIGIRMAIGAYIRPSTTIGVT